MTINLSEEHHDSDCCFFAGYRQRTGGCNSGAVAYPSLSIANYLSVFLQLKQKKVSEYVQVSEADW